MYADEDLHEAHTLAIHCFLVHLLSPTKHIHVIKHHYISLCVITCHYTLQHLIMMHYYNIQFLFKNITLQSNLGKIILSFYTVFDMKKIIVSTNTEYLTYYCLLLIQATNYIQCKDLNLLNIFNLYTVLMKHFLKIPKIIMIHFRISKKL